MSEQGVIALIAVITSGVVGVASLGFNFWNSSKEREHRLEQQKAEHEERYRADLYEKRLAVHQEAYKWLMELIEPLRGAMEEGPSLFKEMLRKRGWDARQWWDANCLYLDDKSRASVVDFIEEARVIARGEYTSEGPDPIRLYRDSLRAVQEGIGMKHLDVKETRSDDE